MNARKIALARALQTTAMMVSSILMRPTSIVVVDVRVAKVVNSA
jgi:hypothetical protein